MACNHDPKYKCVVCHPEIWHPTEEYVLSVNRIIYQRILENLIHWNRCYREGNPKVSDYKYDSYEASLRAAYPDHPFLTMVGHDEELAQSCLSYIATAHPPKLS